MWTEFKTEMNQKDAFYRAFHSVGKTCQDIANTIGIHNSTLHRYVSGEAKFRQDVHTLVLKELRKLKCNPKHLASLKQIKTVSGRGNIRRLK